MRVFRILLAAALSLSVPLAAGQDAFLTPSLTLEGDTTVEGRGSALFLVLDERGATWTATAAALALERKSAEAVATEVGPPIMHNEDPVFSYDRLGAATLTATGGDLLGAILVTGDFEVLGAQRLLEARSETDPALDQNGPREVESKDTEFEIHETLRGEYVNLTLTDGMVELRGDIVVTLYGFHYRAEGDGRILDERTGEWEREETGTLPADAVRYAHLERHTLTLTDATLRLDAATSAVLLAHEPLVGVQGDAVATGLDASLRLDGLTLEPRGAQTHLAGDALLALTPREGGLAVAARAVDPVESAQAIEAATGLPWAWLALPALTLVAIGAVYALLGRRIAQDPLEVAVHAMAERRWNDAIPHLEAVLDKRPEDVVVLIDHALCLEETGRLGAARESCERALRLAPANAEAHYYYARVLARMRLSPACLAHLARALALDPRLAEMARQEAAFRELGDHPQFRAIVA